MSLYVAIGASGVSGAVEAIDDVEGLRALLRECNGESLDGESLDGESLRVEPALTRAGKRLGLRRGRLPPEVAHTKATMAMALAVAGTFDSEVEPAMLGELLDASVAFMQARPWRWVDGDTVLQVEVIRDGERSMYEGSLMGQAGQEIGFMICLEPGTLDRLLMAPEDEVLAMSEAMDMLSVSMDREPAWAARAVEGVLGARVVPIPMRMVDGEPREVTLLELATLSAAIRAASELSRDRAEVRSKNVTGPSVEVVIRRPAKSRSPAMSHRAGNHKNEKIGRNAPCPCGSGRKYKRCCLRTDEMSGLRHAGERPVPDSLEETLVREILAFADREHPGWRERLPESWKVLSAMPTGIQLFTPLLAFQRHVEPAVTARQRYAEHRAGGLVPAVRALLAAQADAVLSVWEVLDVQPGESLEVLDLLTGERRIVHEISGSRSLAFRDALLARVLTVESRSTFAGVHPWPLPPAAAHDVVTAVRALVGLKVRPVPPERLAAAHVVDALVEQWHAAHARVEGVAIVEREVQNTDGEPFATHVDRFAIDGKRWREVADAVLTLPGVYLDARTRTKVEVTFTRRGNAMHAHWPHTVIGTATIEPRALKLEANSRARIDHLRGVLEGALGPMIVHRGRTASLPRTVKRRTEGPLALDAMRIGGLWAWPEELVLREQARQFIESPREDLGGRTPRQAMRTACDRRTLHQVLKQSEHRSGSGPGAGTFIALVREELGLSIIGEVVPRTAQERRLGNGRKISETLLDFASPLLLEMDDDSALRSVLELAAFAWNLHVLERGSGLPAAADLGLDPRVGELLQRRRQFFGEDRRLVEILDVGCGGGRIHVRAAARILPSDSPLRPKGGRRGKAR